MVQINHVRFKRSPLGLKTQALTIVTTIFIMGEEEMMDPIEGEEEELDDLDTDDDKEIDDDDTLDDL